MNKYLKKTRMFIITAFLIYALVIGFLYFMQRSMIYVPMVEQYSPEAYELDDFKIFEVETLDSLRIRGLYRPPERDKPTLVFFHGNAGHIGHRSSKARSFVEAGYGVLLAEYRGYGLNSGRPTEENLYKDARAYMDKLDTENIILYGESLGSGIATQMATEYKIKSLILETPYDSMLSMARERYSFIPFLEYLLKDKYENDKKISAVKSPKLFIIAGQDEIVGAQSGLRLAALADDNKTVIKIEAATHNNLYSYNIFPQILSFLNDQ